MRRSDGAGRILQDSFPDGANDRVAHPGHWIAALVRMNCERQSARRLGQLGYETYVPVQEEVHNWSDRRKKVERIVIPMVIFVRVDEGEEHTLIRHSFIHKFLKYPGAASLATVIPDEQLERLRFLLENAETEVSIAESLNVGDHVRISSGPLAGLEGVLSSVDGRNPIVGILIEGLGYACVRVNKEEVQKISAP